MVNCDWRYRPIHTASDSSIESHEFFKTKSAPVRWTQRLRQKMWRLLRDFLDIINYRLNGMISQSVMSRFAKFKSLFDQQIFWQATDDSYSNFVDKFSVGNNTQI